MGITSIQEFRERFKTDIDCYIFLIEQKWGGGFKCSKCGSDTFRKARY